MVGEERADYFPMSLWVMFGGCLFSPWCLGQAASIKVICYCIGMLQQTFVTFAFLGYIEQTAE